jgi:ABC-type uncharacterized transport system substrate-binding protein
MGVRVRPGRCRSRLVVGVLGLAIVAPIPATAHPHVFIDHTLLVRAGAAGVEALSFAWSLDPLTRALILQSFDADRDGMLSAKESRLVGPFVSVVGALFLAGAWTRLPQ